MGKHAFIVTDLSFGDAGKGSVTDYLCDKFPVEWVIRHNGGAQAAHNVILDYRHHTFSTFGSGTFRNLPTYLSEHFIFNLPSLLKEAAILSAKGVNTPLKNIFVSPNARVTTPWHIALNQALELSRGGEAHGSCGLGVGATAEDYLLHPATVFRVCNLANPDVEVLAAIKERLVARINPLLPKIPQSSAREIMETFLHVQPSQSAKYFREASSELNIAVDPWAKAELVLFEGAQGVLLDENFGFHPFTTWSTTTSENARNLCMRHGFTTSVYGLIRAYTSRHGPGPFPTANTLLIPEAHNTHNLWQKDFRTGVLDLPLLQYALTVNKRVDKLVISHMDCIPTDLPICDNYKEGSIPVPTSLAEQEITTQFLQKATPEYDYVTKKNLPKVISDFTKIPVTLLSYGPTAKDKISV